MLPDRRRREILDRVRAAGAVRVADLAAELGVSDMTVRRDLDRLDRDGELRKVHGGAELPADALASPLATAAPRALHVDRCFLGVHGISDRDGLTTPNMMEAEINRLFLQRCDRSVVLADSTKWGLSGLYRIAGLDEVDTLVTDAGLAAVHRETLNRSVPDLRLEPVR